MAESTVLAALTMAIIEAAESLGLDGKLLRATVGLVDADPDARVPRSAHVRLWEVMGAERPLGLELGARLGLVGLGVIGYAMQHGATAGEALAWLQRYRAVVHPDAVPRMERRDDRVAFVQVMPPVFARLREPVDCQAAATLAAIRTLTGTSIAPLAVALQHGQPAETGRHEAFFGCPISWGAPALEVVFDAALIDAPLPRSEARLFGYLARRAEDLLAGMPAEAGFAERTRREIGLGLAQGEPSLAAVARQMGVSARTLHRRLGAEGTGFTALVEEARRERAFLLLTDPHLSASEIAFLLGYAEPAVFFRAFRRWTGHTPQSWRKREA